MDEKRDVMEKLESVSPSSQPLSQRKKMILVVLFILGIALSYPTVLPFGISCSAILLLQKNKKASIMGLLLLIFQFLVILISGITWGLF